jgi:hypothetical protein
VFPNTPYRHDGGGMNMKRSTLMACLAVVLQSMPALARDMIDEKKHEYTTYGIATVLIASAQVSEMRCKTKGQITLALAKAKRLGAPIDLNDKGDYAAVLFQATRLLSQLQKDGVAVWCKTKSANLDQFLREP